MYYQTLVNENADFPYYDEKIKKIIIFISESTSKESLNDLQYY